LPMLQNQFCHYEDPGETTLVTVSTILEISDFVRLGDSGRLTVCWPCCKATG
jgi:hypothetical protein